MNLWPFLHVETILDQIQETKMQIIGTIFAVLSLANVNIVFKEKNLVGFYNFMFIS